MPKAFDQIGPYILIGQLGCGVFSVLWLVERRGALATTESDQSARANVYFLVNG